MTIHLLGPFETQEQEVAELEQMRVAFETFNMANPCIDEDGEDSDGDDEMITAETLQASENQS